MASGSARSVTELLGDVETTMDEASSVRLGSELFGVIAVLDAQPTLRRALSEPAVPVENKQQLVEAVFGGQVGRPAQEVLKAAVGKRWSRPSHLSDALEEVAITATAASAEQEGKLDDVEDELFRFGRILDANPELREALSDPGVTVEGKRSLLDDVLGRKVGKVTKDLLTQVVVGRHGPPTRGIAYYLRVLSVRHERLQATAWVATDLNADQRTRMTKALADIYRREVHLDVVVDPAVVGGVRVMVGDDLIDSSVETRLADAHRQLIG
jgi:F-type H+-transporting ATPase subunit delta